MKKTMRRFKQALSEAEAKEILKDYSHGILSLTDSEGEPYGVPLSYAYDGNSHIYFHSATNGYKIDCIAHSAPCSFCVVAQDLIKPEEFTTYFRSVITRGSIGIVTDAEEILIGLRLLCDKYSPEIDSSAEIAKCLNHVLILRLDIESISGKEAIELTRQRK